MAAKFWLVKYLHLTRQVKVVQATKMDIGDGIRPKHIDDLMVPEIMVLDP